MRFRTAFALAALAAAFSITPAPASARVGEVSVNRPDYPDTSLADFSFLVPAPAGTRGFVTTRPDGHFYFGDGKRARFWGVNVSSSSIPIPDDEIDAAVERFRRAGFNMLRLEATDNEGMLFTTKEGSGSALNKAYLRKMHRWMSAARRNGLYTYLQLLDFRTFHEADGVPKGEALGRGAKPYAFFDPKLIELQKEFARQLLDTVNPFTGMKPMQDPAVAVIELANEHGLFIKGSAWTTLEEPYRSDLQRLWNEWLKDRYKTTDALRKAWTITGGTSALQAGETLESSSVALPDMAGMDREDRAKAGTAEPARALPRVDDGARFAYDVQRRYFREMKAYLRGLGVKAPVTASVTTWIAPDVKSVADELDFTSENWYWDHPVFEPGKEWQSPFYYSNRDPLGETGAWNAAPYMAALKWKGKPVIIREWAAVWPNEHRASGVPLAAVYASLQDLDGMLAFGYSFTGKGKIGDFKYERDPVRWGLMGLGATMFLRGDVKPFEGVAQLVYDDKALFTYQDYLNSLYRLAWVLRLENASASSATPAGGEGAPVLSLPAQPVDPEDALESALTSIYSRNRNVDRGLTNIGLIQGLQIVALRPGDRFFAVSTPRSALLAGRLSRMGAFYPGFRTETPYGCLWVTSLDGRPLEESDHYLIKMVSIAKNTGEQFEKSTGPHHPDRFALRSTGEPPIVTLGAPSANPTEFSLAGEPGDALRVGMVNGTWEMERVGSLARVYCDTTGVSITVPGATTAVAYLETGQTQPVPLQQGTFKWPEATDRVELRLP